MLGYKSQSMSVSDRKSDVINVKSYGAKGDGVTDDTVAFKNAVATGKPVYVPYSDKFYLLSDTLQLQNSIEFDGKIKMVNKWKMFKNIIEVKNRVNEKPLYIINPMIDGGYLPTNFGTGPRPAQAGFYVGDYGHAISILSSNNVKIMGGRLENTGGDAIFISCAQQEIVNITNFMKVNYVDSAHVYLGASASTGNDYYNGMVLRIKDQTVKPSINIYRMIIDYNGITKIATLDRAQPIAGASTYDVKYFWVYKDWSCVFGGLPDQTHGDTSNIMLADHVLQKDDYYIGFSLVIGREVRTIIDYGKNKAVADKPFTASNIVAGNEFCLLPQYYNPTNIEIDGTYIENTNRLAVGMEAGKHIRISNVTGRKHTNFVGTVDIEPLDWKPYTTIDDILFDHCYFLSDGSSSTDDNISGGSEAYGIMLSGKAEPFKIAISSGAIHFLGSIDIKNCHFVASNCLAFFCGGNTSLLDDFFDCVSLENCKFDSNYGGFTVWAKSQMTFRDCIVKLSADAYQPSQFMSAADSQGNYTCVVDVDNLLYLCDGDSAVNSYQIARYIVRNSTIIIRGVNSKAQNTASALTANKTYDVTVENCHLQGMKCALALVSTNKYFHFHNNTLIPNVGESPYCYCIWINSTGTIDYSSSGNIYDTSVDGTYRYYSVHPLPFIKGDLSNAPGLVYGKTAPTTGTWKKGDICCNTLPSAGGYIGWVCVNAGKPGNWKGFGTIQI